MKLRTAINNLAVYGLAHAAVDGVCAAVLFSMLRAEVFSLVTIGYLFLAYNVIAFGLQAVVGVLVDRLKAPRLFAVLGMAFTVLAAFIYLRQPVAAVILLGLGNAAFHVGGGVISLSLTPRKATAPGIFVAPGALGLLAGTLLGKSGEFSALTVLIVMLVLAVLVFVIPKPEIYRPQKPVPRERSYAFEVIIVLVLFSIAIRSLVGTALVFPWKTETDLLVMLTVAVALGKGLGGLLADRLGWMLIVVALVWSIPFLAMGGKAPAVGMTGVFLFNITMPVTLVMVSNLMPGKPGTAFGLTCLALIAGALPGFTEFKTSLDNPVFIVLVVAVSAAVLYYSLTRYRHEIGLYPVTGPESADGLREVSEP